MERPGTGPVTVALVEDDDEARNRLVASIRSDQSLRLEAEYRTGAEAQREIVRAADFCELVARQRQRDRDVRQRRYRKLGRLVGRDRHLALVEYFLVGG